MRQAASPRRGTRARGASKPFPESSSHPRAVQRHAVITRVFTGRINPLHPITRFFGNDVGDAPGSSVLADGMKDGKSCSPNGTL